MSKLIAVYHCIQVDFIILRLTASLLKKRVHVSLSTGTQHVNVIKSVKQFLRPGCWLIKLPFILHLLKKGKFPAASGNVLYHAICLLRVA